MKQQSEAARRLVNSPWRMLYKSARWQKLRRDFLAARPLCVRCGARASHVDHIQRHMGNPDLFWSVQNLQALCHSCHSLKTNRVDRGVGSPIDQGCDANGMPLDPNHPWRRGV